MATQRKTGRSSLLTDDEIRQILEEANKQVVEQLSMFNESEIIASPKQIPDIQNPQLSHTLYYKYINKFLREWLPSEERYKQARKLIRKQITLFLNDGETSGRDSRQAYTHVYQEAIELMKTWRNNYSKIDFVQLYSLFEAKNKERSRNK